MSEETKPEETPDATDHAATVPMTDVAALTAERDDYLDKWARARADLENYRKRMQREMEEDRKYGAISVIKALLPGLDNLQRAVKAAATSKNADELITGVEMVLKQFDQSLAGLGATPIEAIGQPFDPNCHEAIAQVSNAEHPPMTVLDDIERGYRLHDRIIRPTKVIVSAKVDG